MAPTILPNTGFFTLKRILACKLTAHISSPLQLQLCEEGAGPGGPGGGGGGGEGAESPLTARSLRLERAARAIHAERDRLRTHYQPPYDS